MKKQNNLANDNVISDMTGRVIKHPTAIRYNSVSSTTKLTDKKPKFLSIDLESDIDTGNIELYGCFDGQKYWYYENNFLSNHVQIIDFYEFENRSMVYWSKFDPTQLFKLMIQDLDKDQQDFAIKAYQHIMAQWDKKSGKWNDRPIVERKIRNKYYGISGAIRSCLQFFARSEEGKEIGSIWSYNIAPFYAEVLEKTAKRYLPWYSKISQDVHKLDAKAWKRFHNPITDEDREFRRLVLLSNEYDAKACYYLAVKAMDDFASIFFGKYPRSMISSGSWTRAYIQAITEETNKTVPHAIRKIKTLDDLQSISIKYHEPFWLEQLGENRFKDFYSLAFEIYKGAKIECYGYGYFEEGYTADIAKAYLDTERQLLDLRNSVIDYGTGTPPDETPNSYVMIRGHVTIPEGTEYHPFLIRNPIHPTGNLCPTGDFVTAYWKEERDLGSEMGITFDNEQWYRITTEGKLSVLAHATDMSIKIRDDLIAKNDPNEFRAKKVGNGMYGVGYEATKIYRSEGDSIVFDGLRGGENLNPIYASRTTMQTRCKITRACISITNNGGKVIDAMTDSIKWEGKITDLDPTLWKDPKTVGYFEKPELIKNIMSLGVGRYEYNKKDKDPNSETFGQFVKYVAKTRGVYLDEVMSKDGIILDNISWREALKNMIIDEEDDNKQKIHLYLQTLISVGIVKSTNAYGVNDLGRIVKIEKKIDPISGRNKRKIERIENYETLAYNHYWSTPIPVSGGLILGSDNIDDTLPEMREALQMQPIPITVPKKRDQHKSENDKKAYREKYFVLRKYGASTDQAKKHANKPWQDVYKQIKTL